MVMKIVVIGGLRTRSSVLQETLAIKYGYKNLFECFNPEQSPEIAETSIPFNKTIKNIIDDLLQQDNFVTKIIPWQCKRINKELLENLQLNKFDQIHLIERHDFFESCASLQMVYSTNRWFKLSEQTTTYQKVAISEIAVIDKIKDISNYLEIKKMLNDTNIVYTLHNYNSKLFNTNKIGRFYKNDFNYDQIITNSDKRTAFNTLFKKHFDYITCRHSYHDFRKELFLNKSLLNLEPTPNL